MREPVDYPDFVVRFYDVVYKQIRSHVDETYFLNQIARSRGKTLEIGVGTGRLFSQALKNGADIYGLDVNSKMIEKAKEKIPHEHHHRLCIQDAVTMQLPHMFALILAPFYPVCSSLAPCQRAWGPAAKCHLYSLTVPKRKNRRARASAQGCPN
jgi:SAM-dependent methyltransferase